MKTDITKQIKKLKTYKSILDAPMRFKPGKHKKKKVLG
jgi:hypothetical protein